MGFAAAGPKFLTALVANNPMSTSVHTARAASGSSAAAVSASHVGATHSESSQRANLGEVMKEERTSTKKALGALAVGSGMTWQMRSTHSSPRRNSAVSARCSLERLEERTPP